MTITPKTITMTLLAGYLLVSIYMIVNKQKPLPITPPEISPTDQSVSHETKEQSDGNVTVTVTPQELVAGKPTTFQIVFDTHSVDLDFAVANVAELRDEKGNTYGPPTWSGDPPGGHHRKGTLSFPKPMAQSSNITLTLKDIAEVKERMFVWKL